MYLQILIVTYVALFYGPTGRDEIAINRMVRERVPNHCVHDTSFIDLLGIISIFQVANLAGIGMAVFLAIVPPGNYGGDPGL